MLKLIDQVSPMNDPRDEFEIFYSTRHLQGDESLIKPLRNEAGSYDDEHARDCYYFYLIALGAKS